MKIGLIHNLYGEFSRGGAEKVVAQMAQNYRAAGQDVFIITTRPYHQKVAASADGQSIYYLPSHFYHLADRPLLWRAVWQLSNIFSWRKYYQIKKILRQERPDLVITHNLMGLGFLTPLALRRAGIRQEHFLHDIQLLHPSGLLIWGQEKIITSRAAKIYQALSRTLFQSPAQIISPSRWLLELHQEHDFFPSSSYEIRPLQMTKSSRPHTRRPAQRFLFVGQVETHKGIFLLLSAFQQLSNPALKLQIVGDGQKLGDAKKIAQGDARIEFLGRRTEPEVRQIMAASDCLIVPSLCYENSPNVIYEAHAAGLPIIAAQLGGIPEIRGPRDQLFQPGDAADLRQKMEQIIKNGQ
jgi:glycosyltransferase involved in cell wall biosynthesis